ncbi:Hypothetical predicted protein [Mytilus galloprovincialis]|uniref:Uncharacterized protein n=1 Tax=Mytilus galloprovincialis TaxID=29158 RepID=A0A8B6GUS7_MYTGA|nr:Hypothetical predicted protein [Mytilus galloprovincialis]
MGIGKNQYNLQIQNFSQLDINRSYSCTFGVDSAKKTFNLNEEDYQYPIKRKMIQIKPHFENDQVKLVIHFIKVWPTPICEVSFEGINYRSNKTTTAKTYNGKLYSVIITLWLRKHDCKGLMFVVCHIGNQTIAVLKEKLKMCQVTDCSVGGLERSYL